jgi:hypothetical protein
MSESRPAKAPSIKATGFQSAADDLAKLVAAGRVTRKQLEARLDASDFAYLDKELAASSWVPIATYARVGAVLVELEGHGDAQSYFRARGRRAAERLHKAGLYKQFDASSEVWGKRAGTLATTLAAVLYNFTRWSYEALDGRQGFRITVEDAREFPDYLRFVGEGTIEYMSAHQSGGRKPTVSSQRVTPDKIVYSVQLE